MEGEEWRQSYRDEESASCGNRSLESSRWRIIYVTGHGDEESLKKY